MPRFGKTAAGIALEQILEDHPAKHSKLVSSIIQEFNIGIKFIGTIDNKTTFSAFWQLWMNENKRRTTNSGLPELIKEHLLATITGLGRQYYRSYLLSKGWATRKERKWFEYATAKHNDDYVDKWAEITKDEH